MTWHDVGSEADFSDNDVQELVIAGRMVAVGRADGKLFALDGICPHQGGPIGKGTVENCVLTCPWHGWQFQVDDGKSLLSPHVPGISIPIRVDGDRVFVELARDE